MNQKRPANVKILVSCHKEVILPKSDAYLPVQVGAANTDKRLPGMQPDNEGENISDRNFTFCELTAQYWAWKNLEADYVGLCHYRRFFCFGGQKFDVNDHGQIEADALTEYSIRDFRLDDTDLIINEVAGCDVLTAPTWDVSKTIAPGGVKNTIAEHMIAYGLFEQQDLDTLRGIIEQRQPQFLSAFDSYVNGKKYLGYSCYVMRKDLFDKFCEFEFDVLLAFDKQFDYSYLTATRKRICGYFGEILYSVYVEYLKAQGGVNIKNAPLVFFSETPLDPFVQAHEPVDLGIVWRYREFSTSALLAGIQSLIENIDPAKRYRLTILHEENMDYPNLEIALPKLPINLEIDHAHWTAVPILEEWKNLSIDDLDVVEPVLLPWLSEADYPLLWIDGLAAFSQDPALLLDQLSSERAVVGMQNILLQRELNKPQNRGIMEAYGLTTRGECFSDSTVLLVDPARMRAVQNVSDIANKYYALKELNAPIPSPHPIYGQARKLDFKLPYYGHENQAFRARFMQELNISFMPFDAVSTATHYSDTLDWANADVAAAWKAATSPVLAYCEYGRVPLLEDNYFLTSYYWDPARRTKTYETLMGEIFAPNTGNALRRLLPAGTKRGQMARRMLRRIKG